jgi:hypothetical protein
MAGLASLSPMEFATRQIAGGLVSGRNSVRNVNPGFAANRRRLVEIKVKRVYWLEYVVNATPLALRNDRGDH